MDEMWEILTLMQTGKLSSHHLILIYGREYWDKVLDWKAMVDSGTISEREFKLLKFSPTPWTTPSGTKSVPTWSATISRWINSSDRSPRDFRG